MQFNAKSTRKIKLERFFILHENEWRTGIVMTEMK